MCRCVFSISATMSPLGIMLEASAKSRPVERRLTWASESVFVDRLMTVDLELEVEMGGRGLASFLSWTSVQRWVSKFSALLLVIKTVRRASGCKILWNKFLSNHTTLSYWLSFVLCQETMLLHTSGWRKWRFCMCMVCPPAATASVHCGCRSRRGRSCWTFGSIPCERYS